MTEHLDLLNGAYALDALDDVERAAVERHLRDCETCAIEVAGFREAAARLGEPAAPPAALRDRVLGAARTTRQVPARVPAPAPGRPRLRWVAVAAAAVAVLMGAVGTTWAVQQNRVDRVVAAQEQTTRILAAPDVTVKVSRDARSGRVTAAYSPSLGSAVFTFAGLSSAPSGKTYQLWRVVGGVPSSLRVLPPSTRDGSVVVDDLRPADALAVSLENEGGAKKPTDIAARLPLA
ncbi:anti-sigma factor domain-containing protein [Cryptosporangium sp. NPDC051539]|uniref:anti-sigma factor n=1 Tax=Cryptosporangium sp. NPDC051539 TaxID=3363962 RepID=UPI00378CE79E